MIETRDLAWAAGFLEGEGSFHSTSSIAAGKRYHHQRVAAVQVDSEPLAKLLRLFGGRISLIKPRGNSKESFYWTVNGNRARGIMLTLFPLLSERRQQQIRVAMSAPKGGRAD